MRSLFWRIFASFWLAFALVAGLSLLLGRALNQDAWILNQHPALDGLAEHWAQLYEQRGKGAAQAYLEQRKQQFQIDVQVLDDDGQALVNGTFSRRAAAFEARQGDQRHLPWRRLTEEYHSPATGTNYLLIYRIAHRQLGTWHRDSLFWPLSALGIALIVLSLFSLLLTQSFTRPLQRLRSAVHDLGQTSYQQTSLMQLANRRDEFGVLAQDFNRMGARLQSLISSQRQLLRDVSHELRSPLARLRIALALAERAGPEEREQLWPRLNLECDRLEALISEILALARLDADPGPAEPIDLAGLLSKLQDDAQLSAPQQQVRIHLQSGIKLYGWAEILERALDNLLRNALRFNPSGQAIELSASLHGARLQLCVRDHGPGVSAELLPKLGQAFFRAPGQSSSGHGLGLAIARRAAERHGGALSFSNAPDGGFIACLELPLQPTQAN
ncbi:MAG: HAMP domain-containing sensor histidine kinase [Pseudomonas sp.]|uniref:HAMP domain-containing sensor histidine kinase n=1 Tax=Pseudomonas sp. TaxID=306 RepID=UPI0027357786|nr:HAMP domain-containing sensor histidine kinase [Pseudomonas sp.]MDP3846143.1 HAMP domain-containing sensor histidine kinase [Pseudomonas sp.]